MIEITGELLFKIGWGTRIRTLIHGVITLLGHYFLMYALRPMMTGLPSIITSVSLFP